MKCYIIPTILGLMLLVFGLYVSAQYELSYIYNHVDKGMHIAGAIIVAWMAVCFFETDLKRMSNFKKTLLIITSVVFIGVLWEFAEYSASFTRLTYPNFYHYFHGGNLADTLGDLLADLAGGLIFALVYITTQTSIDTLQ